MKILFLFSIILLTTASALAQTRRALVIGLGEQEDTHWGKINGDKDVPFVKEMLSDVGYKDIHILVNKQATKAGIVGAFKKMAEQSKKGDIIYIHFSGHGQQVTDVNGDEWPEDTLDEAWIPYDAYMRPCKKDRGEKHLVDDEINVLLKKIKRTIGNRGKILVVVDACHSGRSTRGQSIGAPDTIVRRGVSDIFKVYKTRIGTRIKTIHQREQWMTLSACKSHQSNCEIKEPRVGQLGKLTYALYSIAKKDVVSFEAVEKFMNKKEDTRTNELKGKVDVVDECTY